MRQRFPFALLLLVSMLGTPLWAQPDLTATKSNDLTGNGTVGTPFNWSIVVANGGDATATFGFGGFMLTDVLPNAGLTYGTPSVSQSGVTGSAISCTISAAFVLQCTPATGNVDISAGGSFTVTIPVTPTTAGTFDNPRTSGICIADLVNAIPETDDTNNLCSDSVTVTTGAVGPDLTVVKSNNRLGSVLLGVDWDWSLQVANGGSAAADFASGEVILRDSLPDSGLTYGMVSVSSQTDITGSGTISCAVATSVLTCIASAGNVNLAAATGGFTVSVRVDATVTGTFDNPRSGGVCAIDPDGAITEGNETNNSCSDSMVVNPSPDLVATKSNDAGGSALVGTPFNWSITVRNQGTVDAVVPSAAFLLLDALPDASMTYGSPSVGAVSGVTFDVGASISCSITTALLTCTTAGGGLTIAPNGTFTVTFAATASVAGTFDNPRSGGACTVDGNNTVTESDESNNQCSNSVVVGTAVVGPDLTVGKTNDVGGTVGQGGDWDWTFQVANGGTQPATFSAGDAILSDNLPASGLTYGSPVVGSQVGISGTGSISCGVIGSDLTCSASGGTVVLAAGSGSFLVTLPVTPTTFGTFDNPRSGGACSVDPGGVISEGDEGNNACSNSVMVTPSPDLTAIKSNDTSGTGSVGTPFTWSITVRNGGTAAATVGTGGFLLLDTLPDSGMTYGTPSITSESGITYSAGGTAIDCSVASDVLSCVPDAGNAIIAVNGFFTVEVAATPTTFGTFDNPRSSGNCITDPTNQAFEIDESNNTCSDSVSVPPPLPDLTVVKSNDVGGATEEAATWTWSLQVANGGLGTATFDAGELILSDNLPASGLAYGTPVVTPGAALSGTGSVSCGIVSGDLTCTASGGTAILGSGVAFTVTVTVDPSAAATYDNPRSGGACAIDPSALITEANETNNACSDSVAVVASPDLTVAKSNDVGGTGVVNETFQWSLVVSNGGGVASFASGARILLDELPTTDITYGSAAVSATSGLSGSGTVACAIATSVLTCTASGGNVDFGDGGTFTVTFDATATSAATYDNPRSGGTCAVDPDDAELENAEGNNGCSDSVEVFELPDLTATKSNDVSGSTEEAATWTWSVTVANQGAVATTFAAGETILTDELPASDLAYGTASVGAVTGVSGGGTVACTIATAVLTCSASGGDVVLAATTGSFTVSFSVDPSMAGTFANPRSGGTCAVDPGAVIDEADESNNGCSNSVDVAASPDLTVVKSNDLTGSGVVGAPFEWSLVVTNGGAAASFPSAARILLDQLPDTDMTYGTAAVSAQSGVSGAGTIACAIAGSDLTCTASGGGVDFAVGGTFTVSFDATPQAEASFVNPRSGGVCAVDPDDAELETAEGNNGCGNVVDVVALPDLAVVKSNDVGGATEEAATWTWSLTVTNGGAGDATYLDGQAILGDSLPGGAISYSGATVGAQAGISGSGTIDCTLSSIDLLCQASGGDVVIAAGSGTFTVELTADPSGAGTFDNPRAGGACAVDPGGALEEEDETNNTCSDSVVVAASPDLTSSKINDTSGSGGVGVPFDWSITVSNGGAVASFPAASRILLDALPTGNVTYGTPAVTASSGLSGSGTVSCAIASGDLECTADGGNVDLADGGSFTVAVVVTPTAIGSLVNPRTGEVCAVDPDGVEAETDEGNNGCGDTVVAQGPDLIVEKLNDNLGMGSLGVPFEWTLDVLNDGPGVAVFASGEVFLRDDLPSGATYGTFAIDAITGVTGAANLVCGVSAQVLTCVATGGAVELAPGAHVAVRGMATPTAAGALENPADGGVCAVDPANVAAELAEDNNDCSDRVVVDAPDLRLTKTSDLGSVRIGEFITYTLDYENVGSREATGVILTERVPDLTVFVAASSTAGWVCLPDETAGSDCDLDLGTVAAGESGSALFVVEVIGGGAGDSISNQAFIADDGNNGDDAEPADNQAEAVVGLIADIPTLGQWGLLLTFLLLAAVGVRVLRRQRS
ncbi:MAG: hypothetical protein AAF604_04010 [Acidobacteriota bacterium]